MVMNLEKVKGESGHAKMFGKRHNHSRGHSSGFVPDYRHTVNVAGELERFGISGCADSENSCTPKRECRSLQNEGFSILGIPYEVISLSTMSSVEKKNLEVRLRAELEKLQLFKKKMFGYCTTKAVASTIEQKQSTFLDGPPGDQKPCGSISRKLGVAKRVRGPISSTGGFGAMWIKHCETLLKQLMSHKHAVHFNTPVDVVKWNIPDYFSIITHPMDLGTVKKKLNSGAYSSPLEFVSDVRLTFTNAMTYNPPKNIIHAMAQTMQKLLEQKWKIIEKKLPVLVSDLVINRERGDVNLTQNLITETPHKDVLFVPPANVDNMGKKITDEDKQNLKNRLLSLAADLPDQIIVFLRRHSSNQADDEEIELDIDALGDATLSELQNLLDMHFSNGSMPSDACQMEVVLDPTICCSSVPTCIGNDFPEEDVDVGHNDVPNHCHPPIEIEKDTTSVNSTCSTSSSDSGTSSSDSDSVGSECEANNASLLDAGLVDYQATRQHRRSSMDLADGNCIPGRTLRQLQNAPSKTLPCTENGQLEKARLQAEVTTAKEAQRQTEAAQASGVKRQREIQREAAWQALSLMEKTVEINENIQCMEDLKILQCGHLPLKTRHDLGESNPLEKIGLFLKVEKEEDVELNHLQDDVKERRNLTDRGFTTC